MRAIRGLSILFIGSVLTLGLFMPLSASADDLFAIRELTPASMGTIVVYETDSDVPTHDSDIPPAADTTADTTADTSVSEDSSVSSDTSVSEDSSVDSAPGDVSTAGESSADIPTAESTADIPTAESTADESPGESTADESPGESTADESVGESTV